MPAYDSQYDLPVELSSEFVEELKKDLKEDFENSEVLVSDENGFRHYPDWKDFRKMSAALEIEKIKTII